MLQIRLKSTLLELNPEALFIADSDAALIGIIWNKGCEHPVALYDVKMLLDAVMQAHPEMGVSAALEWVETNIPTGPHAPCVIEREDDDYEEDTEDPVSDSDWC